MLRNTQIASVETLETRTLFSSTMFGVAELHEQFNAQHASATVSKSHSSQSNAAAKAAQQAAKQAAIAAKKAAQQAKQAAIAAAKAAKQAAKHGTVTPVAPTTPVAPAGPVVLPDAALTNSNYHYQTFGNDPLFASAGPTEDDIAQGNLGDCYLLSTLAAVAKTDPNLIKNSVTELSNGDFQVTFHSNGQTVNEVVDNKLPVDGGGHLVYAQLGQGSSLWVAIMEKAYAAFAGSNTYNGISGGWMDSVFSALGAQPSDILSATNGTALLAMVQADLNAGDAVTFGVNQPADGAPLVGDHAYTVVCVGVDPGGTPTITLRNPWGFTGAGATPYGTAYITINQQQAIDSMIGLVAAKV